MKNCFSAAGVFVNFFQAVDEAGFLGRSSNKDAVTQVHECGWVD